MTDSVRLSEVQKMFAEECDNIKNLLIEKNRKYGNSAIEPRRIFSKADPVAQIDVRIDDKLSRISNAQEDEDEDVIQDLIGYLILRRVAIRVQQEAKDNFEKPKLAYEEVKTSPNVFVQTVDPNIVITNPPVSLHPSYSRPRLLPN